MKSSLQVTLIATACSSSAYRRIGDERVLLIEVVRYGGEKRYAFAQHVSDVPLAFVEQFAAIARDELGPFFVG
jgi:hypothetical protein